MAETPVPLRARPRRMPVATAPYADRYRTPKASAGARRAVRISQQTYTLQRRAHCRYALPRTGVNWCSRWASPETGYVSVEAEYASSTATGALTQR